MLKFPCLVLDHDDTVVQSETTINYPYFCYVLDHFRPGTTISLAEYIQGCSSLGFVPMCRQWYGFTQQDLETEHAGWKDYIHSHIPSPYPGIDRIIRQQKEAGGLICVVSHSSQDIITRDYQAHFGILPDAIYGWDLPEAQRKPNIYPLEKIMESFDLTPKQLLVVDDMKPGIIMVQNAGVKTAFAGWSKQEVPQLAAQLSAMCDYSFQEAKKLAEFLFEPLDSCGILDQGR